MKYYTAPIRNQLKENKDCAIIAWAHALNLPYEQVRKEAMAYGRKHGKGTSWSVISKITKKYGMVFKTSKRQTVKKFLEDAKYIDETIVVSVRKHVIAVKAGEAIEGNWNDKAIVRGYYIKQRK